MNNRNFMCALSNEDRCNEQCYTCSEDEKLDKEILKTINLKLMTAMEKEFVPYTQASELKQLGFDEPCLYYYKREKNNKFYLYQDDLGRWYKNTDVGEALLLWNEKYDTKQCSAPLYQQAFRWFGENYGDYLLCFFGIVPHFTIIENLIIENPEITFKEAEVACLKILIEFIKSKNL